MIGASGQRPQRRYKVSKKKIILASTCAALIGAATIGTAFGYFSTYESAKGGYMIHLGGYEEFTEEFQDWTKKLVIKNRADSYDDVMVRAKAFAGETYTLTYQGSGWTKGDDGFYYYEGVVKPGESTSELDITIGNIPFDVSLKPTEFNVPVVYETIYAEYDKDGNLKPADWSKTLEVDHVIGGDINE